MLLNVAYFYQKYTLSDKNNIFSCFFEGFHNCQVSKHFCRSQMKFIDLMQCHGHCMILVNILVCGFRNASFLSLSDFSTIRQHLLSRVNLCLLSTWNDNYTYKKFAMTRHCRGNHRFVESTSTLFSFGCRNNCALWNCELFERMNLPDNYYSSG